MNKFLSKKVLLIAAGVIGLSTAAIAGPKFLIETVYYSDATKTVIVGESIQSCNGNYFTTGQQTQYSSNIAVIPCF